MSETKFTPGPWALEFKGGTTYLHAGGEATMCDMAYYPWTPDNIADWHLIAAAPDMYEALEALMDSFGEFENPDVNDGRWKWKNEMIDKLRAGQAALVKARGET